MAGENGYWESGIMGLCFRNMHWIIVSILFFLLAATAYIVFTPPTYTVQAQIIRTDNNQSSQEAIDKIKSKVLIQKVINALSFQVSYYHKGLFKKREIYGDSLPIRIVFAKNYVVDSTAEVIASIPDSHTCEIGQNDTLRDFFLNSDAAYSFAKFKVTKGPAFKAKTTPVIILFTDVDELLEYYYKNLDVKAISSKTIKLSITVSNLKKGEDFLNKLVEFSNNSNSNINAAGKPAIKNSNGSLQEINSELVILNRKAEKLKKWKTEFLSHKNTTENRIDKNQEYLQLNILDAIEPYAKSTINEFVLIPDSYNLNDSVLKKLITQFNETELNKQGALQASKANTPALKDLNARLVYLKQDILNRISIREIEIKTGTQFLAPGNFLTIAALNDSISKTNALLKAKQLKYNSLFQNSTLKSKIVTAPSKLIIIEKPEEYVFPYSKTLSVFFIALIIGLALPIIILWINYYGIAVKNSIGMKKIDLEINNLIRAGKADNI